MKTTPVVLFPKRLPVIRTGTAQAGGASSITLDSSASAIDDYYTGCYVNITNNSPSNALGQARKITAYVGSTKVATVEGTYGTNPSSASTFEVLATDDWINRFADVRAVGGTAQTAGDIMADTNDIQTRLPAALVSGRMDSSVGAMAANVLTATAINADAITAAKVADGTIDAATFAAGAINAAALAADAITAAKIADGAIDAATFSAGAINAAAIAADAITDAKVAADVTIASVTGAVGSVTAGVTVTTNNDKTGYALSAAGVQAIWDALTSALTTAGSIGKKLADWTVLTSTTTADAVWNAVATSYNAALSMGNKLNAAGSAGDPWTTALPGAYGAGTAGKIVGDNLNATVSSRATPAQVATELGTYDAPTHAELTAELATADDAVLASIAALNNLSQANVRTALGLASANLDTQLDALPTNAELATALGTADDAVLAAIAALNNLSAAGVLTQVNAALDTTLSATIPADGTRPTLRQGVYMNTQFLYERTVSGTTVTVKNPDGSTLATLTLGDATTPTNITRTT